MSLLSKEDKNWVEFIKETDLKTLLKGKDENNTPYLKNIFRIHVLLFGETCTGCPSKIPYYINRIKNVNLDKMEQKKETLFTLKKGVIITIPGTSKVYSEHNITDENAIEILKQNPNRKNLFKAVPENLEELLGTPNTNKGGDNTKVVIFDKEFSVDESKELLSKLEVTSNASTVKGIEKKIKSLTDEQKSELENLVNQSE